MLKYSRNLDFEEKVDYNYLRRLMVDVVEREGFAIDNQFDWIAK
jgi:hypothetical protein